VRAVVLLTCVSLVTAACNGILGIEERAARAPDDAGFPPVGNDGDGGVDPNVSNPSFTVTATPARLSLQQGASASVTIAVERQPGFTDDVRVYSPRSLLASRPSRRRSSWAQRP
jgi:hypothetical protein